MPTKWTHRAIRSLAVIVLLASCVGCDQFTKRVAQSRLKGRPNYSFCADLFRLQYAENPGAFLGLGGQMPAAARFGVLVGINVLIATGLLAVLLAGARMSVWRLAGCALLLAGAVGNLIDRLRCDGLVIDFMNLGIGSLRSGIFNVADVAITAGALLLLLPTAVGDRGATPADATPA